MMITYLLHCVQLNAYILLQRCTADNLCIQRSCIQLGVFIPLTRYEVYNDSSLYTVLIKPQHTTVFTSSQLLGSEQHCILVVVFLRASSGAVSVSSKACE